MQSSSSMILDNLAAMCRQETHYVAQDYLFHQQQQEMTVNGPQHAAAAAVVVDMDCRTKMAQWCYKVIDFCNFDRETVAIAMNTLDRFMNNHHASTQACLTDRRQYQLAAMTSLYQAVKIHEPEAMDPALIAKISHGTYTVAEIEAMEVQLLMGVAWRVNTPTTLAFARLLLELLSNGQSENDDEGLLDEFALETVYHLVKIQSEAAVMEYDFMAIPPSVVAYAAIHNALLALGLQDGADRTVLTRALSTTLDAVDPQLLSNVQTVLYQAVWDEPEARDIIQTCNPQYNTINNVNNNSGMDCDDMENDDDNHHDDNNHAMKQQQQQQQQHSYSPSVSPRSISAKAL
mmetsp:Transcript_20993/g.58110  ORF Transcript_20993/g.58110 Transcript_20993/m.58110 type:complete len:346 (+) Transcript_20993:102-1139(+)